MFLFLLSSRVHIVIFVASLIVGCNAYAVTSACHDSLGVQARGCLKLAKNEMSAGSPQALISFFKRSNSPVELVAKGLKDTFNLSAQQVTQLLADEQFSAVETAKGIKIAYLGSDQQIAKWLKVAGYNGNAVVAALKDSLHSSAGNSASIAKKLYSASVSQIAQWLKSAGYSLLEVIPALERVESNKQKLMQALKNSFGLQAGQLLAALVKTKQIITRQNCSAANCLEPARSLKNIGYTLNDVIFSLKKYYNISALAAYDIGKSVFKVDTQEIQKTLVSVGYTPQQVRSVIQ